MRSLCTIDVGQSEPGTDVEVVWENPGKPQKSIRTSAVQEGQSLGQGVAVAFF
jgi:hypothetical protein